MKEFHEFWCAKTLENKECNCWEPGTQMRLGEIENADEALAFALQTHLCYSNVLPSDIAFRVIKDRLNRTGYKLVKFTSKRAMPIYIEE